MSLEGISRTTAFADIMDASSLTGKRGLERRTPFWDPPAQTERLCKTSKCWAFFPAR